MDLWDQINQPVTYAIPFFVLALVVEIISLRAHGEERAGYEQGDARNSLVGRGIGVRQWGGQVRRADRLRWRDLRSSRRIRDWAGYAFGPPGWAPGDRWVSKKAKMRDQASRVASSS